MSNSKSIGRQLRGRRDAAYRLPPLPCGRRDPWIPLPRTDQDLTEGEVDAWEAAAAVGGIWAVPEPARSVIEQRRAAA